MRIRGKVIRQERDGNGRCLLHLEVSADIPPSALEEYKDDRRRQFEGAVHGRSLVGRVLRLNLGD